MLNNQRNLIASMALVLGISMIPSLSNTPATASTFGDEEIFFHQSPKLVETMATSHQAKVSSTYYFTIAVPKNAGEALKAVTISQQPNFEQIDFTVNESRAFVSNHVNREERVALSSLGGPQKKGEVTIVFDEPIQPGNRVRLALKVKKNPQHGGIYLFGVTAFPEGFGSPGLDLGTARFHLFGND